MLTYPVIGGLRKDISTDIVQTVIIVAVAVLIGVRVFQPSVIQDTWSKLPVSHLSGTGYGIVFLLGLILFLPASFFVRMDMWQRIRAAKDPERIGKAFAAAGIGAFLFYALFTFMGMVARAQGLPSSATATLDLIQGQFSSPIVLGLIVGGLFAAVLSSADTFINNLSIFGARLASPSIWGKSLDAKQDRCLLRSSRVVAIVSVLAASGIALWAGDFVELLVGAFSLLLIYLPAVLGSFVESWRNERIAFWTSLIGTTLFLALFIFWNKKLAFAPAVVVTTASYGLTLWVTARRHRAAQSP
ncbi:MAG: hypothetical protein M3436_07150 [Pseudomonadota bacterium]|nr:hypothetical protein [Pseudomonadota bacterium]